MSFPKIEGFVVTEKLGSGSYSTVYKAYTKVGPRSVVAVKCIDKSRVKHSAAAMDNLVSEIRLLKSLRHPHIVEMKDFTWDDKNIYIITEYCSGGDLARLVRRRGRLPERSVAHFLQQLAAALSFMRQRGVVHMDLKPHNLLLHKSCEGNYTLKVADFGFAQHMSDETRDISIKGSPLYMAPELVTGRGYDARVDLWSVGVIMYECLFGSAPYSSRSLPDLMRKLTSQEPIQIPGNASISESCRALLAALLQHDPERRISYEQLFAHPYLDLQHMPTPDNLQEGARLARLAVRRDAAGERGAAFPLYRRALAFLVPQLRAQPAPASRRALADKVHSYMRRAEQLQAELYGAEGGAGRGQEPAAAADAQARRPEGSVPRQDSVDVINCVESAPPPPVAEEALPETTEPLDLPEVDLAACSAADGGGGGGGGGGLGFARRLFRRRGHVTDNQSAPSKAVPQNIPVGENVQDACRIT